jgi:ABC-2 type transport system ATP-binding protein
VIEVAGLVKAYGKRIAIDGLDLEVGTGEILAFLGPNGAGKTTTIEILEGYRSRTAGTVSVLGVDPADAPQAWRERIGIVLQESEPLVELTAAEAVRMQSRYYTTPRDPDDILRLVGLWDSRDQRSSKLSGGQQRRLDLALALIGDPELIFLDEPTTGFDPSARREAWSVIDALRASGTTILLTTHYMDEAQRLADRIVVVSRGRVVAAGTAAELAERVSVLPRISWCPAPGDPPPPAGVGAFLEGDRLVVETEEVVPALHRLTSWAVDRGGSLPALQVSHPTLEDSYLALIGGDDAAAILDETPAEVRGTGRHHR